MTSMDVDGPEFILEVNEAIAAVRLQQTGDLYDSFLAGGTSLTSASFQQIAVVDTNILITGLKYIQQLANHAEEHPGALLIVIPWVVVKELDRLKMKRMTNTTTEGKVASVSDLARVAMRFIQQKLEAQSLALRGQRSDELYNKHTMEQQLHAGDDHILDCCMYFRYHMEKPVILLSNDRNLCIKALVHHIGTLSADNKEKMKELLDMVATDSHVMQIDVSYFSNVVFNPTDPSSFTYVIDEDEEMADYAAPSPGKETNISTPKASVGTKASKYASAPSSELITGAASTTAGSSSPTRAEILASRAHWRNPYYRLGMDLKPEKM
ncbi:PIN domain-containing protein [Gongronella butleri]|nr:PIN domain-containing protein [Gongronella butleri]